MGFYSEISGSIRPEPPGDPEGRLRRGGNLAHARSPRNRNREDGGGKTDHEPQDARDEFLDHTGKTRPQIAVSLMESLEVAYPGSPFLNLKVEGTKVWVRTDAVFAAGAQHPSQQQAIDAVMDDIGAKFSRVSGHKAVMVYMTKGISWPGQIFQMKGYTAK